MDIKAKRKRAEFERKCQDIMLVSEKIFATRGFHGTKMEDIAVECGYAVGALYRYFKSKDEIYYTLIHTRLGDLYETMKQCVRESQNTKEALGKVVRTFAAHFEKNHSFFKLFISEVRGYQWNLKGEKGEALYKKYDEFFKLIQELFQKGIDGGEFSKDIGATTYAVATLGAVNSFFSYWIYYGMQADCRMNAEEIVRLLQRASENNLSPS